MECIETFCHIMVYVVKTFVTTWNSTIIIPKSGSEITKVTKEFSPKAAYSRTLRMCNRMVPAFFPRRNVRFYCFDSRNEVWEWYMTHWPVSFSFVFWGAIFSRQISKVRNYVRKHSDPYCFACWEILFMELPVTVSRDLK